MIKFGVNEYIRNFWFHLCVIVILLVMLTTVTIFVSNLDEQTKLYHLAEKYMDDDSIFVNMSWWDFYEEFQIEGDMIFAQTFWGEAEKEDGSHTGLMTAIVYPKDVMRYLKPRLETGVYPNQAHVEENVVSVLISHNPYGITSGDSFIYYYMDSDGGSTAIRMYAAGLINEGQRVYSGDGVISNYMSYEDFFPVYSYEQTEDVLLIIPEDEMEKFKGSKPDSIFFNGIINPKNNLSGEERKKIYQTIYEYEQNVLNNVTVSIYPEAENVAAKSRTLYHSNISKYVPLSIIIIILFSICITGIVTIKTVKSVRYYGIMYVCGMRAITAQRMAAVEMGINTIGASLLTTSLLTIQEKLKLVGEINCMLNMPEFLFMGGICLLLVLSTVWTTGNILKEYTPIQILKNKE